MGAEEDLIAQLMGQGSTGADVSDIANFQKNIAGTDYWSQAASPILGARFNNSTWSPAQTAAVYAGQGFLGALLKGIGQNQQADQINKVASILPSLYADPMSVTAPEGVDSGAFGALKASAIARDSKGKSAQMADLLSKLVGIGIAGKTAEAQAIGDIKGKEFAYAKQGVIDPNSPQGKLDAEKRAKAASTESEIRGTLKNAPLVQAYQVRQSALQNILANLNNNTTYGDLALINGFQKVQDPEGSVREGDVSTIQGAQDRLSKYYGDVQGWFSADGRLKPEYRKQIAETAANTTNAYGKIYNQYVQDNLGAVIKNEGDPSKVPYVPHKEINVGDYFKTMVTVTNPKTGKTFQVPSDDPRLKQLQTATVNG